MTMITGRENIERVRLLALYHALRIEISTGMRRSSSGRATSVLIREATGLTARSRGDLYERFGVWLAENGILR